MQRSGAFSRNWFNNTHHVVGIPSTVGLLEISNKFLHITRYSILTIENLESFSNRRFMVCRRTWRQRLHSHRRRCAVFSRVHQIWVRQPFGLSEDQAQPPSQKPTTQAASPPAQQILPKCGNNQRGTKGPSQEITQNISEYISCRKKWKQISPWAINNRSKDPIVKRIFIFN